LVTPVSGKQARRRALRQKGKKMNNEKFTETFREEARELLGSLESWLLELEGDSGNAELLSATFRVMHTIKGSAAMFGLDRISAFAHDVESIMSALRDGKIPFSRAFIDNTLAARDYILEMLESKDGTGGETDADLAAFLGQFRNAVGFRAEEKAAASPQSSSGGGAPRPAAASGTTFHIVFVPERGLFRRGVNVLALLAELRKFGDPVCIPKCDAVPPLSSLDPEDCLVGWDVFLTTSADENAIRDVFIFVEGACSLSITRLTG
jgi:two-component system chemotaxis sensor kinase CheA